MTAPMSNDAEVRANQDDRELFATLNDMQGGPNVMSSTIRAGQADDHPGVQAFARHRLAAEARSHDGDHVGEVNDMVERCARVAEVAERHWDGIAERGGITQDDIFISSDEAYVVAGAMASLKNKFRSLSAVPLLDEGRL